MTYSRIALIFLTFFAAFIFMLLPLPYWMHAIRPNFVLLVTLYWVLTMPFQISIGMAWFMGLLLDSIQGTLLGENALCFALMAYVVFKLQFRLKVLSPLLQSLSIFILFFINQILLFWLQGLQGQFVSLTWFFASAILSALLWPWISLLLNGCVKHTRLSINP